MDERAPIQECPVFTPNRREFADPLAYIRSIRQEGQKYGIVRIIPPDDWRPPLAMNLEGLKFRTRVQQIDKLQNRSRDVTQSEFMRGLSEVVANVVVPDIDGKPLDCLFLYQEVCGRKGFLEVSRKKQWNEISKAYISTFKVFSASLEKSTVKPLSHTLRIFYERCLLPMEREDAKKRKPQNKRRSAAWETPTWTPPKEQRLEEDTVVPVLGEVEALLAHERRGVGFRYLVLWKGEPTPTWEPRSRLSLQIRCDYEIFFPDEFGQCKDFYEENNLGFSDQEWREVRRKVKVYRSKWMRYHELLKQTFPDATTAIDVAIYANLWRGLDKPLASETKIKPEENCTPVKSVAVESILAHSKKGSEFRYLVLWEGETDPTWKSRHELPKLARCEYEAFYPEEFGTVSDDEESLPLREVRNLRGKARTEKWAKYCQLVKSTFENNELVEASAYAKLWRSLPVDSSPCGCKTRSSAALLDEPIISTASPSHRNPSRFSSLTPPQKQPKQEILAESEDATCLHCLGSDFKDKLLTCSWCHGMFHTFCLMPTSAPENLPLSRWICFVCRAANDGFGFDTGAIQTLVDYRKQADEFVQKRFPNGASGKDIIKEYWKIVEGQALPATVRYGSDIDTLEHGSGFPTSGVYARSGWNLCNLPKVANSLLKHLTNISGITVPWFYVGMMFSSFCWHNEDHYCYSINYVHTGAAKQWYGVPGLKSPEFEACAAETLPDLFRIQPDLLYQMVTMLSPFTLRKHGVPVYTTTQQPGQFVVTFPQSYHAGFNHGFNMAEAVNFAPADWLSFGVRGMEHYRRMHRPPVFPHDLLMCRLAADPCTGYDELAWLLAGLRRMVNEERAARLALYAEGVRTGIPWDEHINRDEGPSVENAVSRTTKMMKGGRESLHHLAECCLCRHALWVSSIRCGRCSSNRITCLRHGHLLCACPAKEKQLLFRYSTEELETLVTQVTANLQKHEEQAKSNAAKRKLADQSDSTIVDIMAENNLILASLPMVDDDCKRNSKSRDSWHTCIQDWLTEVGRALSPGKQKVLNKLLVQELLLAASELNWGDRAADVRKHEQTLRGYESLIFNMNTLCQDKQGLKDSLGKCGYSSLSGLGDFLSEMTSSPILCDCEHLKILEQLRTLFQKASDIDTKLRYYTEARNEKDPAPAELAATGPVSLSQLVSLQEDALKLDVTLPTTPKLALVLKAVNQWMEKVADIVNASDCFATRYEAACGLLRQGSTWEFLKEVQSLHTRLKALIEQTDVNSSSIRSRFGAILESSALESCIHYSDLQAAATQARMVLRTREAIQLDRALSGFHQWTVSASPKLNAAARNLASFSVAELSQFLAELPTGLDGVPHQKAIAELVRARRWFDEMLALPTEEELELKRPALNDAEAASRFDSLKPIASVFHDLVTRGRAIAAEQPLRTEWLPLLKTHLDKLAKREAKATEMMTELASVMSVCKPKLKLLKRWLQQVETFPIRLAHYSDLRSAVCSAEDWCTRVEILLNENSQVSIASIKQLLDASRLLPVDMAGHATLGRLETYECEARDLLQHILAFLAEATNIPSLQTFLVREPPTAPLTRLSELSSKAKTLLSRVAALKLSADCVKTLREVSWRLQVRLDVTHLKSLDALEILIADKNTIPSMQEDCAMLGKLLDKGRDLHERAQVVVERTAKSISVEHIAKLNREIQLLPFVLPVETALQEALRRVRKWSRKASVYLEPQQNISFELAELVVLQEEGTALKLELPELEKLQRAIVTVQRCQSDLDTLFPRPSVLALKDLLDHILQGDKIDRHCLCLQDKPGSKMVCCDECERWFHDKCVRVTTKAMAKLERYSCPRCCEKQMVPYPFGSFLFKCSFPSLIKLQNVITEFQAFPAVARFALFLQAQDVFLLGYNFRKRVRTMLYVEPDLPTLPDTLVELAGQADRIGICRKESKLIAARTWALQTKKMLAPYSQTELGLLQETLRTAPPKEDLLMPGLAPEDSKNDAWAEILDMLVRYVAWGHMYTRSVCSSDPVLASRELTAFHAKTLGAVKITAHTQGQSGGLKKRPMKDSSDESAADDSASTPAKLKKRSKRKRTVTNEKLYCLCRKPYADDFMVGCDECDEWFHPGCINKTMVEIETIEHFICATCQKT